MGKQLSLLERLDNTLDIVSSESEGDHIYSLLYDVAKKAIKYDYKTFYKKIINYQSLSPDNNLLVQKNERKIIAGKLLADKLRDTIILPERNLKHYGAKYRRAIKKEYNLLIEFARKEENGETI
ncbi:MAG: hypothetical protein ABIF18_00905 [archaeon]